MIKSGLIVGAAMVIVVAISAASITPFCALCVPVIAGLAAGYLAGVFEKPAKEEAMKRGAGAGAIAGAIGILGNIIAGVLNALVLQNPDLQINNALGLPTATPGMVWAVQIAINLCIGVVNIGLNAALGAGGAAIWSNMNPRVQPDTDLTPSL